MTRDGECSRCGLLEDEHRFVRGNDCSGYQRDEGVIRARRAADAFGDAVQELVRAVAPLFERAAVLGVRVSEELGETLGVPEMTAIRTAFGVVRIEVEPEPRRTELTIAALRGALAAAVAEIEEHNTEYGYRTPESKLDHWRHLYAGDPMAETFARLDVAGTRLRGKLTETLETVPVGLLWRTHDDGRLCPWPAGLRVLLVESESARHHFTRELPRWDDDGGAPAASG